jgi:hypothetical protein
MGADSGARKASVLGAAALLLAGCGAVTPYAPRTASWMAPESSNTDLLYVSEYGHSEVQVYSYPQDKLIGTLTGLRYPEGECTDAAGDVYVANSASDGVSEFAHGGTTPIASYVDPHHEPFACSIDPTTGNLAVTEYGEGTKRDSVAIFSSASTPPMQYINSLFIYAYCAYDAHGDLFADGYDDRRTFRIVELPKGRSTFRKIKLNVRFAIAGNVQWDGTYVTVSDGKKRIYRFSINGTQGQAVGTTTIDGVNHGLRLFSFQGGTAIVPNVHHEGSLFGKGTLQFYNYPAGGEPTKILKPLDGPDDAVVSGYSD